MKRSFNFLIIALAIFSLILIFSNDSIVALVTILISIFVSFVDILAQKKNESRSNIFNRVIDSLNIIIWEYNKDTNRLILSENYRNVLNIEENVKEFKDLYSFISEEDLDYIRSFFDEIIENSVEEVFTLEFTILNNKSEHIYIECSGKGERKDNKYIISGTFLDTTEKVNEENILRISEKNYRRALEGSKDIMFYINLKNNSITLNGKIAELIGLDWKNEYNFTIEEWLEYIVEDDREYYKNKYFDFLNDNSKYFSVEYRIYRKDKKILWLKVRGKRINEEDGYYIYGSINDDTDRKEKELKINYMSYYDEVTGIPNRRYFIENATKMLEVSLLNNMSFAIIFIDLDNFKYVNDTYGHSIGDKVLKQFCDKIINKLRNKYFFARFGGDEFVISIENVKSENEVVLIIDNIIEECNIPLKVNGTEIYNTVSIGISICSNRGETIQTLLKKADIAMYEAKSSGKNRYVLFNKKLLEKMDRELELSRCIRKSLDNNEIYILLQPKYWAKSAKIQGFECLARWQSNELGSVSPVEFIPSAENNGFIIEIGKFIIKDCFKKCKILSDLLGENFKIAINLSEIQIRDEELVDFIEENLRIEEINPKNIEFEVTESIIMTSVKNNIEILERLKKLGVSIALDDFGTGYSSLNYLRKLPIDTVKIDKSFVDDVGKEFKDECIIEKIIELSHLLDLEVVAEGVENKEQLNFLNNVDCDIIQGYYFSKPRLFNEILELLK